MFIVSYNSKKYQIKHEIKAVIVQTMTAFLYGAELKTF